MEGDLERMERRLQAEIAALKTQRDEVWSAIKVHRSRVLNQAARYSADEELWSVLDAMEKEDQRD